MKKIFFIIILIALFLNACGQESEVWQSLVDQEFSNLDVWAGSGFYFHEENHKKYCTFMIYGSGVHVAGSYTSEVEFDDQEKMIISLPSDLSLGYLGNEWTEESMVALELTYTDQNLYVNDISYEVNEGINNYQYINEFK